MYFQMQLDLGEVSFPDDWTQEQRNKVTTDIKCCMVKRLAKTLAGKLPRLRNCRVWQDQAGNFFFQADRLDEYDPEYVVSIMKQVEYDGMDLSEVNLNEGKLEVKDGHWRMIKDGQHRAKGE
jgi:hypothetical protein